MEDAYNLKINAKITSTQGVLISIQTPWIKSKVLVA